MNPFKSYLTLCRPYIALFAACSTATGYFVASGSRTSGVLFPAAAVFFLACGASALNQYQERDLDARMERTRKRPLPSGCITPANALLFGLVLIIAGLALLIPAGGMKAALLGVFAILWYNGLYVRLKQITAFAAVPGAVVGMFPPAIGWVSAGGQFLDVRLASICLLFFLWQVPHFWLLLLSRGREYEAAGLPSLTRLLSGPQIARLTFTWIVAAAIASLALPLYGSIRSMLICLFLLPPAAWLIWAGRSLAGARSVSAAPYIIFRKMNLYLLLIMTLLVLDSIVLLVP